VRIAIWVLVLQLPAAAGFAQSLGEAAQREKKRREENRRDGAKVRVITEAEVGSVPGASTAAMEPLETVGEPREDADVGESLAPNFTLPDRAGRSFSLGDFRGRPLLVDFWATWCGPCRSTMPEIERIHRKYGAKLQVVGINLEGRTPEVLAYLDEGRYSFRVLFDSGNWKSGAARNYGVTSIPRTFLIDHEGRILFGGHPQNLREEQIEAAVAR